MNFDVTPAPKVYESLQAKWNEARDKQKAAWDKLNEAVMAYHEAKKEYDAAVEEHKEIRERIKPYIPACECK